MSPNFKMQFLLKLKSKYDKCEPVLSTIGHIREQWCIQSLSDTSIPVWVPNLGAHIKRELMQNSINSFIISSMQMRLHVLRHLI